MKTYLIFLVALFCIFTFASGMDYLKIAMHWPVSLCNLGTRCQTAAIEEFKIHGLWPFHANHTIVSPPCAGYPMPPLKQVTGWKIKKNLDDDWPSFKGDSYAFWKHEWDTHGICSGMKPFDYFNLAIFLAENHLQLKKGLESEGVKPRKSPYIKTNLLRDLNTLYAGNSVELRCNRRGRVYQLFETHHCYSATGSILSCTTDFVDCGSATDIEFPDKTTIPPTVE